jgi:signal transduction histidine kinase/DNA-binding response OmpR family regulator/sugar lactone lactonase YvrE
VNSIIDNSGLIWIATNENGIVQFNPSNNSYRYCFDDKNNSDITYNDRITILHQDSDGSIWIGTLGRGLYRYYQETGNYEVFRHSNNDTTSINNDEISTIYEDQNRTIWIGSNGGLNRYIPEKNSFRSLPNATARVLFEDSKKNFWLGTYMYGLSLLDRNSEKIIVTLTEKDGLPNNTICSIREDDSGNLWIGTNNGLSKFNFEKKTFRNYYVQDGLNKDAFQINASVKGSDGILYFGIHESGLNYFNPDSIKDDPVPPQVVIENISLFNRPDEKLSYEGFIPDLEMIELPYNQNDLHFEYVGLHFSEPARNKYKYILEGFDKNWIDARNQKTATYTNLDPGEYIFKVNAANRDGVWNESGASIKIIINPPIWATTWAYLLYIILAASLIYYLWKLNVRRIKTKHEFEMSKFEAEKLHEVDELKSRFFANISHEFRTPLTLILGPAKDIQDKTKESETKNNIGLIKRNANRLLRLVNQLLDLSKLEAGRMKLETREENIIPLLKGLVLSFSSLADSKKIILGFNAVEENLNAYFDSDKVEKVVNNLLSNAFKFTPDGGKIDVTVEKMATEVELKISDSGMGIPNENIDRVFDRFYQVDGGHTREREGTGIGLALTKELVELHKGKIGVESETGKGTTFVVKIPLGKDHLKPEEIVEEKVKGETKQYSVEKELIVETNSRKEKTDIDVLLDTEKPLLLVIEDNGDVRKYIISHLEDNYRIQEAVDGQEGLEQAFNHIPDLIISDVMMPKMDGFELCSKLKTDERTSHIPIIMLTAKATSQDKISGYEIGADDYIMKPFDATELKIRVKNLIDIRRKLQEKFRSSDFSVPPELSSIDDQFMNKVLKVINKHLSEEEFSIDDLGKEVSMSREHLYRKLKAISGHSPSLFIRSVRLAKAKKLIKERKGTISEISFLVGFGSPAYFGKCFKEEYGYSPGEL